MNRVGIWIILLFLLTVVPATALELTALYRMGNYSFPATQLEGDTYPTDRFPWGITFRGSQNLENNMRVEFGYTDDPIMDHLVYSTFIFNSRYIKIGLGPMMGVAASLSSPIRPGVSASFSLVWPGRVFLSYELLSSIGSRGIESGANYDQSMGKVSLGVYLPYVICTLGLEQKSYGKTESIELESIEKRTDYFFNADIYNKNIPVQILLGFIYRVQTKSYTSTSISSEVVDGENSYKVSKSTREEVLNSAVIRLGLTIEFASFIAMIIDGSVGVYSFGNITDSSADSKANMILPKELPKSLLFEAEVGLRVSIPTI